MKAEVSLHDVLAFHGGIKERWCQQKGPRVGGWEEQWGPLDGSRPWMPRIL